MRELTLNEVEAVDGGIVTFIRIVGGAIVKYVASSNEGGKGFEEGDPSIPANVYGA